MAFFGLFNKKKKNAPHTAQEDYVAMQCQLAQQFADAFNEAYDERFDFSKDSLAVLDELLQMYFENKDNADTIIRDTIINQTGAYLFEVARRNYGGRYYWYDELDQPILVTGQPDFEISILAHEKIMARIDNGPDDNIPFYFKGYVERIKSAKKGDAVLIT